MKWLPYERSISCERRIGGFLTTLSVRQCLFSLQNYEEVCHYKWTKFRGDLGVNGDKNLLRRRQVVNMLRVNLLVNNWPHELKQVSSLFNLRSANFFYKISLTDSVSYLISGTFYYSTCTKVVLRWLPTVFEIWQNRDLDLIFWREVSC
jgi:hypothetical protein